MHPSPHQLLAQPDADADEPALATSADTKAEAELINDLWAQLDELHDALREAYTDHVVYPMKDTPGTYQRAWRLYGLVFRFGVSRGLLLSRVEALRDPEDAEAYARIAQRFDALLETHPMPQTSADPHTPATTH